MTTDLMNFANICQDILTPANDHDTAVLEEKLSMDAALAEARTTIMRQQERIAHLEALSIRDELTGLRNRRGFYEAFTGELERCDRGFSAGGLLILIDLDNFKEINDTYGHLAGDACLKLVGYMLQNEIRAMDVACRMGGDEFVLLLSNTSKILAASRSQELAAKINRLSLAWDGHEINIRASLGLKDYVAGDQPETVFSEADMAMYAQKKARGRKGQDTPVTA